MLEHPHEAHVVDGLRRWSTGKTERLVGICRQAGADTYMSGPAARGYIDAGVFAAAGIELSISTTPATRSTRSSSRRSTTTSASSICSSTRDRTRRQYLHR